MVTGVEFGVAAYAGMFGRRWYGWARKGGDYRESPKLRVFKTLARIDAWNLARKHGWK